ncbi:MAG TPA: phosphopyruvate hydratase, partial [Hymenobacter sp.]
MQITTVRARQIFDSRGFPTVECDVILDDGSLGRAAVPSGASTGSGEALELRDGGTSYGGKGVSKAVGNIMNAIAPALIGKDAANQQAIDDLLLQLDGTDNKSNLGANATLAVSLAVAKAAAAASNRPLYAHVGDIAGVAEFTLPMPMLNILNGGKHAEGSTDIQEFMVVPVGANDFADAMRMASDIFHTLGKVLRDKGYATTVGDEGGYAPRVQGGSDEALQLIEQAIETAGYRIGSDVGLALDVASSELVSDQGYDFAREGVQYTTEQLIARYKQIADSHSIISIEDGLAEDDWEGWAELTAQLGAGIQLVGDDLLVTNTKLLQKAIDQQSANAILIKPNQIGTLTETIQAVQMAQQAGWRTVMSHRSGETEDA